MTTQSGEKGAAGFPQAGAVQEPIEQATYTLLVRTSARLEGELNRLLRPLDLTGATYNILRILDGAGASGRSCGDISEQLIAEVPDMTRLLDRLERLEYVSRARSNVDRRMVRVTITEKGKGVLDSLHESVRDCHIRQLGHLGQTKLAELGALLKIVLNQVPGESKAVAVREVGPGKHPAH
jgi:DNA-binding MarR family transcriptional regulator